MLKCALIFLTYSSFSTNPLVSMPSSSQTLRSSCAPHARQNDHRQGDRPRHAMEHAVLGVQRGSISTEGS